MKKKENEMIGSGFGGWLDANPEMVNVGVGMLKAELDERRQRDLARAEIARTQYGYLTGAGIGNPEKHRKASHLDRALQGYIAGKETKDRDAYNKKSLELLNKWVKSQEKKPGTYKNRSESVVQAQQNPHVKVAIPENIGAPIEEQARGVTRDFFGGSDTPVDYVTAKDYGENKVPALFNTVNPLAPEYLPGAEARKETLEERKLQAALAKANLNRNRLQGIRN